MSKLIINQTAPESRAGNSSLTRRVRRRDAEQRADLASFSDLSSNAVEDGRNFGLGRSGQRNDLLVYDATDTVMDGGCGIDFLLELRSEPIEQILGKNSPAQKLEALVFESAALGLLDMRSVTELGLFGITRGADNSGLQFGNGWHRAEDPHGDNQFVEMRNKSLKLGVLVERFLLGR